MLTTFLALSTAVAFDPSQIDPSTVQRLTGNGEMVLVEESSSGTVKMVTGGTLVKAPPQKVWNLITAYESYPTWMPQTTAVTVLQDNGNVKDVHFQLDFKFSVITKTVEYTLRQTLVPTSKITWTLMDGDFKTATGAWHVVPVNGGTQTMVFYSTLTDLESMGWIVTKLLQEQPTMEIAIQASTCVMVVKAVKAKAEKG